jgi:hypothetical protein
LPPQLTELEQGNAFADTRQALQREFLVPPRRPAEDAPLFTSLLRREHGATGLLTFELPDKPSRGLPVFTTPTRAADYRQTLLSRGPASEYLVSTPVEFVAMLRDIEPSGIEACALDRCPRCEMFMAFGTQSMRSAEDIITVWAITTSTQQARVNMYLRYAVDQALAGRLDVARDVALETIAHVTLEEARVHTFLGHVAVALNDRGLLREAVRFLRFLREDGLAERLQAVEDRGTPDFTGLSAGWP